MSKETINGFHTGKAVSKLSVHLESADNEANKFLEYFYVNNLVDNDEIYFIKLTKK
jgi:hypothetical protein